MAPESFAPGVQVVHTKMQIIGKIVDITDFKIRVKLSERLPIQTWNVVDVTLWEPEKEYEKIFGGTF